MMQQGLLGNQMPQEQPMPPQGEGELPRTPGTFLTLQVMQHFFNPETAQEWIEAASAGNPAAVISQLALVGIQEGMGASGGRVTPEEGQAALQEVITAMVLLLVSAEVLPQEAAEPVAQEAMQIAMSGGQEQQQPGGMLA